MRKILAAIVLTAMSVGGAGAATVVYTTEADFLNAIGSATFMLEDFDGYTYGSFTDPSLTLGPVNGYSCVISAAQSLYSGDGNMSTNAAADSLDVAFTGDPVYSTGGWFFVGDVGGNYIPGQIVLNLSDGTNETFDPPGTTTFRGFVSDTPISSFSIAAPASSSWPTMDHFYVGGVQQGTVVGAVEPVPTMSATGMMLLVLSMIGVAVVFIRRRV